MLKVNALTLGSEPREDAGESRQIDELKMRSPGAWTQLFEAYHAKIWRYAWAKLRSVHEADDVAAVVYMRALTAIDSYEYRGTPIIAWLYRIASNVIKERQRQTWREDRNKTLDGDDSADWLGAKASRQDTETLVKHLDLLDAINCLTNEQKTVITLVYVSGFSVKEVAQILGKGERGVYYIQARGLLKLKRCLE